MEKAKGRFARALARMAGWHRTDRHRTPSAPPDPRHLPVKSFVAEEVFLCPQPIPQHLLQNCVVLADRFELLRRLPRAAVVAEVGTDYGDFAKKILEEARPRHLHIFDLSFRRFDHNHFSELVKSHVVTLHEGDSSARLSELPDLMFDWIYIDADHSFEGVKKDIDQAMKKIKRDGFLVFNDYMVHSPLERIQYGVMRAVNDLCIDHGFEVAFFAFSILGYHDIALRRKQQAVQTPQSHDRAAAGS